MIEPVIDSERALLAVAINYPKEAGDIIEATHEGLFTGKQRIVFNAIKAVLAVGGTPDLLTVSATLDGQNKMYPVELSSEVATPANIEFHITKLRDRVIKSGLITLARTIAERANDNQYKPLDIVADIERFLTAASVSQDAGYIGPADFALMMGNYIEAARKGQAEVGYETGYSDLDAILRGLKKQELTIVGARPSIGKTAFAVNIAYNLIKAGYSVGFFSAEMSSRQLGKRMVSVASSESIRVIEGGGGRGFTNVMDAIFRIGDSKFYVNDSANISMPELIKESRSMKRREGVQLIMVDYISLITHENRKIAHWEQVGDISRRLKQLARELDLPIIALSQVTRDTEGKEPNLSSLRYSGSIEQDADVIMFLHRERDVEGERTIPTDVIVAKNRNGETGRCQLMFVPDQTRFTEIKR